jgi:hypothetical protein
MRRKLLTQRGRTVYAKRKAVVEPVFGQIKQARGLRQFLLRGLEQVQAEWELWCLTHNLLKLHRFGVLVAGGEGKRRPFLLHQKRMLFIFRTECEGA